MAMATSTPPKHRIFVSGALFIFAAMWGCAADSERSANVNERPAPSRIFAFDAPNSRAALVRQLVDRRFDEVKNPKKRPSSIVLAKKTRSCGSGDDTDCEDWQLDVPLDVSPNTDERLQDIDWQLLFDEASPRSLSRALGRSVSISDGETSCADGICTRRAIRVYAAESKETIVDARERSYDSAHERSWARARKRLSTMDDDQSVTVGVLFSPHTRPVSKHSVNWFDVDDPKLVAKKLQLEHERRINAGHKTSRTRFDKLGICRWLRPYSFANGAVIECVPHELTQLIDERPEFVAGVYLDEKPVIGDGSAFRDRSGSALNAYLNGTDARTGAQPSPLTGRDEITVAYADPKGFYQTNRHPAFFEREPTCIGRFCTFRSRVRTLERCDAQSCWSAPDQGTPLSHGSRVIGGFQSILDGQDPDLTNQSARRQRSYGAFEAGLHLYDTDDSGNAALSALEEAARLHDGRTTADIWGYSASTNGCDDPRGRWVPWTAAMDTAYDRGLLAVQITGNSVERHRSSCTTTGLASRSDSLVVGGFADTRQTLMSQWRYDSAPLSWASITDLQASDRCPGEQLSWNEDRCYSSAEGGGDLFVGDKLRPRVRSVVDLTAPSGRRFSAVRTGRGDNDYQQVCCGSSHAAPKVAAAAVSLRDWGYRRGLAIYDDPTLLYVMMLLGGDFTGEFASRRAVAPLDQYASRPTDDYRRRRGFSRIWGAGRLHVQRLLGEGSTLDSPFSWALGTMTIDDETVIWRRLGIPPTPADTSEIVALFAWDEPGLSAQPDDAAARINFTLRAAPPNIDRTCPAHPNNPMTVIGNDISYDTKKRIALGPELVAQNPHIIGQCIYVGIHAIDLPGPREGAYITYRSR